MFVRMMVGFVTAAGALISAGCSQGLPRLRPPSINASSAAAKAIAMYDTDKDGKLSGAELDKCPALKAALAQIDTTGQGAITAAQIAARIKQWQEKKIGRMRLDCIVSRNGKPLAGAEVKFVPEEFLGDDIKMASGKTNKNGRAWLSIPTTGPRDPPGVAFGFYRVEVTKAGDNIPAKYNAETTLGIEVALDSPAIHVDKGIRFNLEY
jgi:hypothetical protein